MLHSPLPFGIYEPSGMDKVGVHRVLTATLITFVTLKLVFNSTKFNIVQFQANTTPQKFLGTTNCSLTKY